jgi:8-oxoguanine DNA glycosylase-like protein
MACVLAESVTMVPSSVRRLVCEWRAAGSPEQDGIKWPRRRWAVRFPSHAEVFAMLPDRLSRPVVRRACLGAAASPAAAERAFLTVMAWGYGRVGYGPYRVQRVLDATGDAGARLQIAASELASGGTVRAYALLGDTGVPRLPRLGPAFGTKFLYFCSPAGGHPALILDGLVATWLRGSTDLQLNGARWSTRTYERYVAAMLAWADELAVAAYGLETCIFSAQAEVAGGQWAHK